MKLKCAKKKTSIYLKEIIVSIIFLLTNSVLNAQNPPIDESYFEKYGGIPLLLSELEDLSDIIQHEGIILDHGARPEKILLYVSEEGYRYLLKNNKKFSIVSRKKSRIKMKRPDQIFPQKSPGECMPIIDFYPTYEAYEEMMYSFEENHPEICKIKTLGTLNSGRKILAAQIGDKLDELEDEPNFFYSSTMHGDETTGFLMLLQYIDHLLCNYSEDPRITHLLNNINIYINPLANPNGTYRGGNHTVEDAIRFNSSFADLNRNFPDPKGGDHPDNRNHQEETIIFMSFADSVPIHLSCNIHGGIELANYPWDTYEHLHADTDWWEDICRTYADTVQHNSPDGYFTDQTNGVTNGFAWFEAEGGRQDYMTYFKRGREFTLEVSSRKLIDSDQFEVYWNANRNALLNYMEEALSGLRGTIQDCETGSPLEAEILIADHDFDNSSVFSNPINGSYFRYLDNGTYNVLFKAPGYDSLEFIANITDKQSLRFDVELCPQESTLTHEVNLEDVEYFIENRTIRLTHLHQVGNLDIRMYDLNGKFVKTSYNNSTIEIDPGIVPGYYLINIIVQKQSKTIPIIIH